MTDQKVVDLVDAGVPADQGLSSLGLIMQLAGNVLAAYASLMLFMLLLAKPEGDDTLWIFLVLGASVARSLLHKSAGTQLLYGRGGDGAGQRLAGLRRYVTFGIIQSVAVTAILMWKLHVPNDFSFGIALGLVAWPAGLAVMLALPRFKRFAEELPMSEDKGFEAASILMTVFGLCGLIGSGTMLLFLLDLPGKELQRGAGVLVVLSLIMLCARSFIHVQAGASGLRETSVDRSVELANRYANFGVISSFCAGGAFMLFAMSSAMNLTGLALVCGLVWMLMAWPMIIRRFFSDRQFSDLLAGDNAPIHRRAPDAGLSGLGWLLIAHAFFSLSFLMPQMTMAHRDSDAAAAMFMIGGAAGMRSVWWSIGLVILQAWAGFELVRMSAQSRMIAMVYGLVGIAVTLYVQWPFLQELRHAREMLGGGEVMMIGPLVISLIVPTATILLVNRKIAPTARARFKK